MIDRARPSRIKPMCLAECIMENLKHSRVNVMVRDMNGSIEFYSKLLGLELVNHWGDHYAEIKANDLLIGLHPSSDKVSVGNSISIGFGVGQFDETVKSLESKGIQFRIEKDGWIRLAHFADPDGNPLYLAENKE